AHGAGGAGVIDAACAEAVGGVATPGKQPGCNMGYGVHAAGPSRLRGPGRRGGTDRGGHPGSAPCRRAGGGGPGGLARRPPRGAAMVLGQGWQTVPRAERHRYTDLYGNDCWRLTLPVGETTLRYDALVAVPDATEAVDLDAREVPPDELPDDTLVYTMPSRYCL